jgi:hypothetical protein
MVIVERVKDLPPVFACADEVHLTQPAQLMRHGRLSHFEFFGESADTHFTFHQKGDKADAAGIAEGAEEFSKFDGFEFGEFHG